MTNLTTLRAVLSRVESLKGPLTRGEAEKVADKLFMLSTDRVEWLDVVAALGGGRSALGSVVGLVEREMPECCWETGKEARDRYFGRCVPTATAQTVEPHAKYPNAALALLAAYLCALIAEAELAGQRAGKAS